MTTNDNKLITKPTNNRLELDTAAILFPLVFAKNYKSLARFNVVMHDEINLDNLQISLNSLLLRFPTFFVRLKHDCFNYFFEPLDEAPKIIEEIQKPFLMTMDDLCNCAFKIFIFENHLAFEFFHSVSDGYGASVFLRTLLAEYIKIEYGVTCSYDACILNPSDESKLSETSDDFLKNITSKGKTKELSSSYTIKGTKQDNIYISELTYKTDELLECARKYGVTLTSLLSAVLVRSLSNIEFKQKRSKREIKLSIPVNLRRQFDSQTLRNFSIPITIKAPKNHEEIDLAILCQSLHKQIRAHLDHQSLKQMNRVYVKLASSKILAISPLFLKKIFVRAFYTLFKNTTTMTLTNFGSFSLDENLLPYIQKTNFILSPKPSMPYSFAVVSLGNVLTITLTRSIEEDLLVQNINQEMNALLAQKPSKE